MCVCGVCTCVCACVCVCTCVLCTRVVCTCVCVCRKWRLESRAGAVGQRGMRVGPDHSSSFRSEEELGILIKRGRKTLEGFEQGNAIN